MAVIAKESQCKMNILAVIDMQNDFIDGALGTKEAQQIVPKVIEKINNFDGKIIYTQDTHYNDYLETNEGRHLPVEHCIDGSDGHAIKDGIYKEGSLVFKKNTFGSYRLIDYLKELNRTEKIDSVTLIGVCTDICVISNALTIKTFFPEIDITVDSTCCAGVTPQSHQTALDAMKPCQINIV